MPSFERPIDLKSVMLSAAIFSVFGVLAALGLITQSVSLRAFPARHRARRGLYADDE